MRGRTEGSSVAVGYPAFGPAIHEQVTALLAVALTRPILMMLRSLAMTLVGLDDITFL
jgi:hypothetical protein